MGGNNFCEETSAVGAILLENGTLEISLDDRGLHASYLGGKEIIQKNGAETAQNYADGTGQRPEEIWNRSNNGYQCISQC